jgi:hypothetical protein
MRGSRRDYYIALLGDSGSNVLLPAEDGLEDEEEVVTVTMAAAGVDLRSQAGGPAHELFSLDRRDG